jgi:hypothetical protein
MKGRRILFQDPDPRTVRTAQRALAATGSEVDVLPQGPDVGQELLRRIQDRPYDLLMLNFDPPVRADPGWSRIFDELERRRARVVLHATAASEDYLPMLAERRFVKNLIAKNGEPLQPEELITTAEKLLRGDLFGLEKYLAWGVQPLRLEIRGSRDKLPSVRAAGEVARQLGCNERTVGLIESVADELITNAIWNAPRDGAGCAKYASLPRRQPLELERHEASVLEVAGDGTFIGVAQRDPFGALTQETLVGYLNRCLVEPAPLDGTAGAGIGLYRVFQSLSKFVVNVAPGRCTEVMALLDLRLSMRRFRHAPKSFHIFIADGDNP